MFLRINVSFIQVMEAFFLFLFPPSLKHHTSLDWQLSKWHRVRVVPVPVIHNPVSVHTLPHAVAFVRKQKILPGQKSWLTSWVKTRVKRLRTSLDVHKRSLWFSWDSRWLFVLFVSSKKSSLQNRTTSLSTLCKFLHMLFQNHENWNHEVKLWQKCQS